MPTPKYLSHHDFPNTILYDVAPRAFLSHPEIRLGCLVYEQIHLWHRCSIFTTSMDALIPRFSPTLLPLKSKGGCRPTEPDRLCESSWAVLRLCRRERRTTETPAQWKEIYLGLNDTYGVFSPRFLPLIPLTIIISESAESSTSSLLRTPNDAGFPDNHFTHNYKNDMLSESHDFTTNQSDLYPAISSLEVELSMVTEAPATPTKRSNNPYANDNYATPQRASQVFEFLTTKKSRARARSQPEERGVERQLPALPVPAQPSSSRFSFSSAESHEHHIPLSTHIHSDENESKSHEDAPNWPSASNWIEQASTRAGCQDHSEDPEDNSMLQQDGLKLHEVVVNSGTEAQASRIPRGPRPLPQSAYHAAKPTRSEQFHLPFCDIHLDSGARRNIEDTLRSNYATISAPDLSLSNDTDAFTPAPSRPPHHRTASRFSTALAHDPVAQPSTIPEAPYIRKPVRRKQPPSKWGHMMHDKENDRKGLLPITPVRSHSVFRAPRSTTPSPASSTDLSPVARQLMADLRTQRMRARERDRKNGKRSTTSKLKA